MLLVNQAFMCVIRLVEALINLALYLLNTQCIVRATVCLNMDLMLRKHKHKHRFVDRHSVSVKSS